MSQNNPAVYMQIDNYAMGNNSSNITNNYLTPPSQTTTNDETLPNLPNKVLEAISTIQRFLSRQEKNHEIKISKEKTTINGKTILVGYEACKLCKNQHGNLTCPSCQRIICSNCITKRAKNQSCLRCKGSERVKNKLNSEFDERIEKLLRLENDDKVQATVLVEVLRTWAGKV